MSPEVGYNGCHNRMGGRLEDERRGLLASSGGWQQAPEIHSRLVCDPLEVRRLPSRLRAGASSVAWAKDRFRRPRAAFDTCRQEHERGTRLDDRRDAPAATIVARTAEENDLNSHTEHDRCSVGRQSARGTAPRHGVRRARP